MTAPAIDVAPVVDIDVDMESVPGCEHRLDFNGTGCSHAAEWVFVTKMCGHTYLFCNQHKELWCDVSLYEFGGSCKCRVRFAAGEFPWASVERL